MKFAKLEIVEVIVLELANYKKIPVRQFIYGVIFL